MVDLQVRMRPVSRQFVEEEVRSSQWARRFFAKQAKIRRSSRQGDWKKHV